MTAGVPKKAMVLFKSAFSYREAPELVVCIALCQLAQGQKDEAFKTLAQITGQQAALPQLYYWRARVKLAQGKSMEACRLLDVALSLGGDRPYFLAAKAMACKAAGRTAQAVRSMVQLVRKQRTLIDPALFPDPAYGVADLVSRLLRTFPNRQKAKTTSAYLFYRAQFFMKAEELLAEVMKRWGQVHNAVLLMARTRQASGDRAGALRWAERAVGSSPGDPSSLALRAEIYLLHGRKDEARADLERAVKADPKDVISVSRLAKAFWENGQYARSERYFRYALARDSNLAFALHGYAQALDRRKQTAQAEIHYQRAIASNPANPLYRQSYAVFLQRQGRKAEAKKQLAVAARLNAYIKRYKLMTRKAMEYIEGYEKASSISSPALLAAALRKLSGPDAPRAFLRARLAVLKGQNPTAWAQKALSGLHVGRLLLPGRPIQLLELTGRADKNVSFSLRQNLPAVNPRVFP